MDDHQYFTNTEEGFLEILPLDKICTMLKEKFNRLNKQNKNLKEQLKKINNEKWKDKELLQMKKEMMEARKDYWRGFPISKEEEESINKWIDEHEEEKHPNSRFPRGGAIGGSYVYSFTPTSIGTVGEIQCVCGEKFCFQNLY